MSDYYSSDEEQVESIMDDRDLASVVKYMQSPQCKNVFVMVGAGMSVAAGIPDFRSPGTGLYDNLAQYNLPYPEAIFELGYFLENPSAFYAFASSFDPTKFRPTLAHSFVRLLDQKGYLHTCFTQNIDGLEGRAHIPEEKLVEAHGSVASQRCASCRTPYDGEDMWAAVHEGRVAYCEDCGGPVKSDIVFFGEALPQKFFQELPSIRNADLLLILGTSLKVFPFAALASYVPSLCPRILINLEKAGDIGNRANDVLLLGKCDDVVRQLARGLGWEEELEKEWETTKLPGAEEEQVDVGAVAKKVAAVVNKRVEEGGREKGEKDEVEKLADIMGKGLEIGDKEHLLESKDEEKLGYASGTKEDTGRSEDDEASKQGVVGQEAKKEQDPAPDGKL